MVIQFDMNAELKSSAKIVIVGAGFAGASTAWWLRQLGEPDILLLERETAAGLHASGQNAAMARQATTDPFISRLLAEGVRFMAAPPKGFRASRQILRRAGSALMGSGSLIDKLADVLRRVLPEDEFETSTTERLAGIPYLAGLKAQPVLYTKSDGFIDLESLLCGFLDGSAVMTSCEFLSAAKDSEHWSLNTSRGTIRCSSLVIASGGWVSLCGERAGAGHVRRWPVTPTLRHLFQSPRRNDFSKEAPFVWDISTECYVRPDGGGALLMSACDQDPCDPRMPLLPSRHMPRILKEKISRAFPSLTRVPFHRYWAGTRTLTPDGRFVIGPDPVMDRLFWVAALGGHGVTTSPAVGRIAAETILGVNPEPKELSPSRF